MNILRRKSGFTLVETILAITVIGLAITAAYDLTRTSNAISGSNMRQFMALHEAEEGLEIVRHLRDSNWLQNVAWRENLAAGIYEIRENTLAAAAGTTTVPIAKWELAEIFSAPETGRMITLHTLADGSMRALSEVKYADRGKIKSVSLTAEFTDWKKGPL